MSGRRKKRERRKNKKSKNQKKEEQKLNNASPNVVNDDSKEENDSNLLVSNGGLEESLDKSIYDDLDDDENVDIAITLVLEEALEDILESRSSTREQALKKIIQCFRRKYLPQELENIEYSILEYIKSSFRKGTPKEKIYCLILIPILVITRGDENSDVYFTELFDKIMAIAKTGNENLRFRAVECLSYIIFLAGDDTHTQNFLELITGCFDNSNNSHQLNCSLLDAYCLITTTLSEDTVCTDHIPAYIDTFTGFLENSNIDVRNSAGKAIATLVYNQRELDDKFEIYDLDGYTNVDTIVEVFTELSNFHSKKISKNNIRMQKKAFSSYSDMINGGQVEAVETLDLEHSSINIKGWVKVIQYQAIKNILQSAIKSHFLNNPLLGDIFNIFVTNEKVEYNSYEKKLYKSKNSIATKQRTIDRRNKQRKRIIQD
eukprot:TRINITY_DN2038_c3_g1_i1.p1 TRINITY_DN2038_c3_g1~~TRINITY_DN2038_c3_g1_i1.p1  ORF type:complete len:432 (-),score=110.76 TRINITY_DN2038_c3_g1_i1:152-1447(-)